MLLTAQAAEVPGYAVGQGLGALVGILIPVLFLFKAIGSFSRPDHNRKCALALALVMGGWALSSVTYAVTLMSDGLNWLLMISAVPSALSIVTGVVLGILGLVELGGVTRPISGRGQAIGSLIVGTVFLIAIVYGILSGASGVPRELRMDQQSQGTKLMFGAKNFSYVVPEKEWVQVQSTKLHPIADVAFIHPKRKVTFLIIAENLPPGIFATQDLLIEASRAELKKSDPGVQLGAPEPVTVGSLLGHSYTAQATLRNQPFNYRLWVHSAGSRVYRLITWGPRGSEEIVSDSSRSLVQGFELLTP
jgi:hypothetical protein